MSSVITRNRFGRILYHTNRDPVLMLSHSLGTTKPQCTEEVGFVLPVQLVADYLNEKIHSIFENIIRHPV